MAKKKDDWDIVLYDEPIEQPKQTNAPWMAYASTPYQFNQNPTVAKVPSLYDKYTAGNPLAAKPTYAGTYDNQMTELYNKIVNRDPFSYDVTKDPLYQGYKDQYIQGGKLAMRDTMGQAAALTGGYASTYGQQVGQQAYDAYLQKLGDVIPTLYGMAYDQYKDAGNQLLQQYSMLGDMRDQEYGRYRDQLSDWENERNYRSALEQEDYNRQLAADERAYSREVDAYNRWLNEDKRGYDRQQDAYANLYTMIKTSGYYPSDAELQAAGMSREAANAIAAEYQRGVDMDNRNMELKEWSTYNSGSGGGGSSGGGGGYTVYSPTLGSYVTYYDGDIWQESYDQYQEYGYQETMNDLNKAYENGEISLSTAINGASAAVAGWAEDHLNNTLDSWASKNNNKSAEDKKREFKDRQVRDRL